MSEYREMVIQSRVAGGVANVDLFNEDQDKHHIIHNVEIIAAVGGIQ